jgi:DNA-binding IscR family transcriptional regulator
VLTAVDAFPETAGLMRELDLPPRFHERFAEVQRAYEHFLSSTTIADLIENSAVATAPAPLAETLLDS